MSSTTVPVFRPTLAEFRNFAAYIDKIDAKIGDFGLCKVCMLVLGWDGLPLGFHTPK